VHEPMVEAARGVLKQPVAAGVVNHWRRGPAPDVAPWIVRYWTAAWNLAPGEKQVVETLPHPNIYIIFENGGSIISGVHTARFVRLLEGQSRVFGIKFRPGGFRPFLGGSVSQIGDSVVPAHSVFGAEIHALEKILLGASGADEKFDAADSFFRRRLPQFDEQIDRAANLVTQILNDSRITTVKDLVNCAGIGKRSLQRLFSEYVGVSPKWVIRRYRLHELIERFRADSEVDWAQIALDLGYFDQAHLINDFKATVGCSPLQYRERVSTLPVARAI
jgi:AraC-like DNA-binding protein